MEKAKQERQEKAAAKARGHNSIVFRGVEIGDEGLSEMDMSAITLAGTCFIPQCTENEGIRSEKDARDYITKKDLIGSFKVMVARPFGVEKDGNIRRYKQEVAKIS